MKLKQISFLAALIIGETCLASESAIQQLFSNASQQLHEKNVWGRLVIVGPKIKKYEANFGYADKDQRMPITNKTQFPIASLTKILTAAAILKVIEEKALSS